MIMPIMTIMIIIIHNNMHIIPYCAYYYYAYYYYAYCDYDIIVMHVIMHMIMHTIIMPNNKHNTMHIVRHITIFMHNGYA